MLVELCASNHGTYDGLVNGVDGIFKASTTYCDKTIIRIMFQISKIRTLTKGKYSHYYHNIEWKWTPIELIIKDIRIGKSQSFIIRNIQFPIQLSCKYTSLEYNFFMPTLQRH